MSDEKIKHKSYEKHSARILNRLIKLRVKQIEGVEAGHSTVDKSLIQLRYELNSMMNVLMERSLTRNPDNSDKT